MNYYPFHIGDFAAHTAHLSWEEDIAYRRMLDWYYLNERSLPLDVVKVARLIRMPKSVPAIQIVLDEFFVQSEDGWHNKRADEELTSMLEKQEQQATKDEHEAERMRRYRERRAAMFSALRAVQVVPAWDVPMKELQRLFDMHCNAPETDLQREQVQNGNASATAIPTPTPTPTPEEKRGDAPRKRSTPAAEVAKPDDVDLQTWTDWLALRKAKRAAVSETVLNGARGESAKAGMTLDAFLQVWCLRGSQGLMADWLRPDERRTASRVQPQSFAQQEDATRRKRWEEMTGRKWPEADAAPEFIDVTEVQRLGVSQ